MESIATYRVTLERTDGTETELGLVELQCETYGVDGSTEATDAALTELQDAPGGMLRWRNVLFRAAHLRTLRIDLVVETRPPEELDG